LVESLSLSSVSITTVLRQQKVNFKGVRNDVTKLMIFNGD